MSEEQQPEQKVSVSVPIGALAAATVVGLAGAAYALINRETVPSENASPKTKSGGSMRKKVGLLTLITLIENDVTRKGLVALLRAIAKRS